MVNRPGYLNPFILDVAGVAPEALSDRADLYLPEGPGPFPVVVLVPGMLREPPEVGPREWPVFRGYAALLVSKGVAAVVVGHELTHGPQYPEALRTVLRALDSATARPEVDSKRTAFWVFSAGGPLALALLAEHGDRFESLALTYPLLESDHLADWPSPDAAVAGLGDHQLVMTTVGQEVPDLAPGQRAFLTAARASGAEIEHIDLPEAYHGFDSQDPTDDGRRAIGRAVRSVAHRLLGTDPMTDGTTV
ncbi:alpha/beta hydrolase family protein [Ornithinicoccus hortensis]|uniref:Dienelactone hydrolase n=1 Tax=Ornithinicoccus hortensis TaxID=82346 RepID=A0A542YMP4_9MICO|nr:hypothetical protein [Ornithinicoccus hortensis]TQL49321.1 dienelactone hydrolase [Ornithinicoccus hortensis]